jgi:hypothetical protein
MTYVIAPISRLRSGSGAFHDLPWALDSPTRSRDCNERCERVNEVQA